MVIILLCQLKYVDYFGHLATVETRHRGDSPLLCGELSGGEIT